MYCIYTRVIVRHSPQIDACLLVEFETLIVQGFSTASLRLSSRSLQCHGLRIDPKGPKGRAVA